MAQNATPPLRKPMKNALNVDGSPVTIKVGKGDQMTTLSAHEVPLKAHSDFFAAALKEGWKEAKDHAVSLPEETPEHFRIFLSFIYGGMIFSQKDDDSPENHTPQYNDREWARLCSCWLLGDKIQAASFKDAVADALAAKMKEENRIPLGLHRVIYPGTAGPCAIRRFVVDIAIFRWSSEQLEQSAEHDSWASFFRDVAVRLRQVPEADRAGAPPFYDFDCAYHEHEALKKPCYKTMF